MTERMLCLEGTLWGQLVMSLNIPPLSLPVLPKTEIRAPPHSLHITGYFNFTNLVKKLVTWYFLGKGERMSTYPRRGTKDRTEKCFHSNLACWTKEFTVVTYRGIDDWASFITQSQRLHPSLQAAVWQTPPSQVLFV